MPRPVLLVALTAFLMMLGLGVLFPVLPYFTRELGLSDVEAGLLMSAYPSVGVVMSPLWGRVSEHYGRKLAIVTGLLGFAVSFVLFGLGDNFGELLAARLLGGLFSAAAMPAIFAYAADVTKPDKRSSAMGILGASIALGISFGPLMGGILGSVDLRLPYFVSGGLGLATAVAVLLLLPESLTPELQASAAQRRARLRGEGLTTRRIAAGLMPFFAYSFLTSTGRLGVDSTLGFLVADRLAGTTYSVGLLIFSMGMIAVLVQGVVISKLARRYSDQQVLLVGTTLMIAALALIALANSWASLATGGFLLSVGFSLLTPTFNAQLSRAAEGIQGEAQGLNNSAQSLSRVFGPLAFISMYSWLGTPTPYLAASLLCLLALVLAAVRLDPARALVESLTRDASVSHR
jgi:MFS family permease